PEEVRRHVHGAAARRDPAEAEGRGDPRRTGGRARGGAGSDGGAAGKPRGAAAARAQSPEATTVVAVAPAGPSQHGAALGRPRAREEEPAGGHGREREHAKSPVRAARNGLL